MKSTALSIFLSLIALAINAQQRSIVYFKDKLPQSHFELSVQASERRASAGIFYDETDYPVNKQYLSDLKIAGARVKGVSRWLNAALVEHAPGLNLQLVSGVLAVVPVKRVLANRTTEQSTSASRKLGFSDKNLQLHNGQALLDASPKGAGIKVAVFDAGFRGVDTIAAFKHLFDQKRLMYTRDLVGNNKVYQYDEHGTQVLSVMAGLSEGVYSGTAVQAEYYLFVTENVASETQAEEFNWLMAAELADSLGVQIINSSLGYTEFDDPKFNYTQSQLDGKTAICTQAANMAARKGILVVNSAGNYRQQGWGKIGCPADADSILAVAALGLDSNYASFSSPGPSADGRIKPDVSALGFRTAVINEAGALRESNGTSFASPLMAGLCASLWSLNPSLSAQELRSMVLQSAHLFDKPNNDLGYGIPNMPKAMNLVQSIESMADVVLYPNPAQAFPTLQTKGRSGPARVDLYSTTGNSLGRIEVELKEDQDMDLRAFNDLNLETGTYFLVFRHRSGAKMLRWLKP